MNFIITAIITIMITFVSGLMLEYYKNLAPKILYNVRDGIPIEVNGKKIRAYIINVKNPSNKTIHELSLNIQSAQSKLNSTGAKITKGLKFDSSTKDDIVNVFIPFLSKGDDFTITVYLENQFAMNDKPVLVIRSPENFKPIDCEEQKLDSSIRSNVPKNINHVILKAMGKSKVRIPANKKHSKIKREMIIIAFIFIIMTGGYLGKSYLKDVSAKASTSILKKYTGTKKSAAGTSGTTRSTKKTTTKTKNAPVAPAGTTETKDATAAPAATTETKDATAAPAGTTETKDATEAPAGTTETKDATEAPAGTSETKDATQAPTGTTETKYATGTAEGTGK